MWFNKKRKSIQIPFGVPYFDVYDTKFSEFSVPVAVRGFISVNVKNYKKFQKQTDEQEFCTRVKSAAISYVKEGIAELLSETQMSVLHLEKKLASITDFLRENLTGRMKREFKIAISAVDVTAIEVDKSSFGYSQIKALTQDVTSATVQAQTELRIQEMRDRQRIETEKYDWETWHALASEKPKNGLAAIAFIIAILALGCSIAGLIF